jgi:hypothetical protein
MGNGRMNGLGNAKQAPGTGTNDPRARMMVIGSMRSICMMKTMTARGGIAGTAINGLVTDGILGDDTNVEILCTTIFERSHVGAHSPLF